MSPRRNGWRFGVSGLVGLVAAIGPSFAVGQELPRMFGAWRVDALAQVVSAATASEGGSLFGQFCPLGAAGACEWIISLKLGCTTNDRYPVLGHSTLGATHLDVRCGGPLANGWWRYNFTEPEKLETMVRAPTGRLGFAVPVRGETFQVFRFDLTGSAAALAALRGYAAAAGRPFVLPSRRPGIADEEM